MAKSKRNPPENSPRSQDEPRSQNDISESQEDKQKLKQDTASLDLPDVRDIPGQEHIHVAPLGELSDTTISSDDEEGVGVFEDDADDEIIIVKGPEDAEEGEDERNR